ncbi:MAG TPA: DUF2911 domain-containing protein [Flavisolibacter sp.]|jgi:hypothetical protein|nr:DUF2911 domain-containing protein [Flavisolibacter sp.]
MKYLFSGCLLWLLVSCHERAANPPSPRPQLISKDSNLLQPELKNPYAPVDISPMDMSYYPKDYPVLKMTGKNQGEPLARVIYSRPHRQGRTIFGALLKYGEPWRLGANEASEIEFFKPVTIEGKKIPKGKYIIYCIPFEKKWTIALNSNLNTWGLKEDTAKDLDRFEATVHPTPSSIEYFTMVFEPTGTGADLIMAWDTVEARLPIQF